MRLTPSERQWATLVLRSDRSCGSWPINQLLIRQSSYQPTVPSVEESVDDSWSDLEINKCREGWTRSLHSQRLWTFPDNVCSYSSPVTMCHTMKNWLPFVFLWVLERWCPRFSVNGRTLGNYRWENKKSYPKCQIPLLPPPAHRSYNSLRLPYSRPSGISINFCNFWTRVRRETVNKHPTGCSYLHEDLLVSRLSNTEQMCWG